MGGGGGGGGSALFSLPRKKKKKKWAGWQAKCCPAWALEVVHSNIINIYCALSKGAVDWME